MPGRQPRMVDCMVDSPVGTGVGGGFPLGRVGDKGVASGGSGLSSVVDSGDAQIQIWESGIVVVVLVTLCGMVELPSKSSALLAPTAATLSS